MNSTDEFLLKRTKEALQRIMKDHPEVENEYQALGFLIGCYESREVLSKS